jgi:predicted PurR-regulated permease PerM
VVILFSLALWGTIWGIIGMFLCVPITAIAMIVMAQFPQTRPIAIFLSANGKILDLDTVDDRASS